MYVDITYYCCIVTHSIPTDEHLPDLMWCREPFFEELNEIEALNDIPN